MSRVLVAGCGYVGSALAARLAAAGHEVLGLRRRPAGLPAGVAPVAADLGERSGLARALDAAAPGGVDALVYAAAADRRDEAAYRRAYVDGLANALAWAAARERRPACVLFTSSTAVYGHDDGSWVDEESPTEPTGFSGRVVLAGEQRLAASGLPASALRLGGIYGPGRTRLLDAVREGRARIRPGPPRWTNRIHRDDAAGALHHLLGRALAGAPLAPVYVGVDDEPAPEADVLRWLARHLGVPEPPLAEPHDPAAAPPPGRGAGSNKRCRNARLRGTGYRFTYPTWREGYASLARPSPPPPAASGAGTVTRR